MNTRDISPRLFQLCNFLYSEANRLHALKDEKGWEIQREADEVRSMAQELQEMNAEVKP